MWCKICGETDCECDLRINKNKKLKVCEIHRLKTWPEYFRAVTRGEKTFEIRKNDRNFEVEDILRLEEYDPGEKQYTGEFIHMEVTYILDKQPFVPKGYVCMGIRGRIIK